MCKHRERELLIGCTRGVSLAHRLLAGIRHQHATLLPQLSVLSHARPRFMPSQWLKASDRCPLCKVVVQRVLHNIKSPKDYKVLLHARRSINGIGGSGGSNAERSPASSNGALTGEDVPGAGGGGGGGMMDARGAAFRRTVYRRGLAAEPPEQKAR